jgi:tetratricopeptide (TPR) repeat protein
VEGTASAHEVSEYEFVVTAHAAHYSALAEREGPRLNGGGTSDGGRAQMQALAIWRIELENINAALDTAINRSASGWLLPYAYYFSHLLEISGDYYLQRERYAGILKVSDTLGHSALQVQARIGLGTALWRLGKHVEASSRLEQARAMAQTAADLQSEGHTLSILGYLLVEQGDFSGADSMLCLALALSREAGSRFGEARALNGLGTLHDHQGDFPGAIEYYSQALEIQRSIGNRQGEAYMLNNQGTVHVMQGDYVRATELYELALSLFRESNNRYGQIRALGNLGNVHYYQGNLEPASELCSQALEICQQTGDRQGEANNLMDLGNIWVMQGESLRAAALFEQAREILSVIGNRRLLAFALNGLASIQLERRDYNGAAALFGQAGRICNEIGDRNGVATISAGAAALLGTRGYLYHAFIAQSQARKLATAASYIFEPIPERQLEQARTCLDAAAASGEISAEQLAAWQAEGEALSLDELAQFTLDALAVAGAENAASQDQTR